MVVLPHRSVICTLTGSVLRWIVLPDHAFAIRSIVCVSIAIPVGHHPVVIRLIAIYSCGPVVVIDHPVIIRCIAIVASVADYPVVIRSNPYPVSVIPVADDPVVIIVVAVILDPFWSSHQVTVSSIVCDPSLLDAVMRISFYLMPVGTSHKPAITSIIIVDDGGIANNHPVAAERSAILTEIMMIDISSWQEYPSVVWYRAYGNIDINPKS